MKLLLPEQLALEPPSIGDSHARQYVRTCAGGALIGNVSTALALLDTGHHQFPVSINHGHDPVDNCYVVSPQTAYSGYAREELQRLKRPWLAWPLKLLTQGVDRLLSAAKVDRLVQVNNWLLSTNLYPADWDGADLPAITELLRREFPDHGFGFRSLNDFSNLELRKRLQALGYLAIPSRQVYLFDGREGENSAFLRHHNTRLDATLLRRSPYTVVPGSELSEADFQRIEQLYNLLYLDKYSRLNPHYSAQWLQRGQAEGWLDVRALRNAEGRIDGALGWFANSALISTPIVGYDTALPQRAGLYRHCLLYTSDAADE